MLLETGVPRLVATQSAPLKETRGGGGIGCFCLVGAPPALWYEGGEGVSGGLPDIVAFD